MGKRKPKPKPLPKDDLRVVVLAVIEILKTALERL